MEKKKEIAIVGAGLSGVLACKYALSKGFKPIVFESRSQLGGVWVKALETTKLQTPREQYQFSDYPWPKSVTEAFPRADQVWEYIKAYANHFDVTKHIKFNTKVVGVEFDGVSEEETRKWSLWGGNGEPFSSRNKWKIMVQQNQNPLIEVYEADFVVLCVGRFSDLPNIPDFPPGTGPEAFHGKVIHSMEYSDMDFRTAAQFVKGKHVAVVGFQKSAVDIALECVAANGPENPCTMLYRTKHWPSDFFPWGIPIAYLYFNRFSELLVHKPGEGLILSLLATFLAPLRWIFSKIMETHLTKKHRLRKFKMVPEHSYLQQINTCLTTTIPANFYDKVEEGSLVLKRASKFGFCQQGVIVDGETTPIKTDVVIYATGFKGDEKLADMFVSKTFRDYVVGPQNSTVPLYRECIHPRIPQLGVIGFSESLINLYTSEMRCRWLFELLDGTFKLPSIEKMEKDVSEWEKYKKEYAGRHYRRSCVGALHIWYNDQLCKDMGWNPKRKKGLFADMFQPYGPMDYTSP